MHTVISAEAARPRLRMLGILTAAILFASGLVAVVAEPAAAAPGPAAIEQRNSSTVTADFLPTVQLDSGVVWAQVMKGNIVYAGGSFSNARPAGAAPGTNLMPRSNILAYDITTGVATSFAPSINGAVKSLALSPDGSILYVGGSFSQVNGQTRYNIAAFNTSTGALVSTFKPAIGGSYINAIVATASTVYVGGLIGAANGVTRKNLAAVSPGSGALLGWAPTADLQVDSMVLAPAGDKIIAAGRFEKVNGTTSRGLAALSLSGGALLPWSITSVVKNGLATGDLAGRAGIWSLTTDASGAVYGTAWVYGGVTVGNLEGMFSADGATGGIRWIADCHGDHYGIYSDGTNVYSTSHEHDCQTAGGMPQLNPAPGNMRNATVYTAATKGTLTRTPYAGGTYSDWSGYPSPAAVNWYVEWLTGTATGQGQAAWSVVGNGAYVSFGGEFIGLNNQRQQGLVRFARTPSSGKKQGPRVSGAAWTPVARSATSGTARVQVAANWDRDDLNLTYELWQSGGTAAIATTTVKSTFWYRPVITFAVDGLPAGASRTYRVIARDGDGNRATSADVSVTASGTSTSAYADAVLDAGATSFWRLGPTGGATDQAGSVNLTPSSGVGTTTDDALASEADGSATFSGTSTGMARSSAMMPVEESFALELWFKTSTTTGGKLIGYGNYASGSSTNYDRHLYMTNDGRLVFGVKPGVARTVTSSGSYRDNQWHLAVAQIDPWAGAQLYVDGVLVGSDPSITAGQVFTGYWRLGGDNLSGWPNRPTSDYFNGRIDEAAIYPTALTGAQIAAHYNLGKSQSSPVADFTASGSDLSWNFDARASTGQGGSSISSYAWDFGDGTKGTGATTSRTYTTAGTYTVSLTVTDGTGAKATTTRTVTATSPAPPPQTLIVQDDFSRTVAGGWGSANIGGAWSTTAGSAVGGGVGTLTVPTGQKLTSTLTAVSARDVDVRLSYGSDKVADGGGMYFVTSVHRTSAGEYRLKLRISATGVVTAYLGKLVGTTETILATSNVSGYTHVPGGRFQLRLQAVTASGSTTVNAKVWAAGAAEPGAWLLTASDAQAEIQGAGQFSVAGFLPGSVTNGPVVMSVDDITVR